MKRCEEMNLLHDELIYAAHLIMVKQVNKDYTQPDTGERTKTQNFDGAESFWRQPLWRLSVTIFCVFAYQKNFYDIFLHTLDLWRLAMQ